MPRESEAVTQHFRMISPGTFYAFDFCKTFGSPTLFNASLAFSTFSLNKTLSLYLLKDLSTLTIGNFDLFNSSIFFINSFASLKTPRI
jgi:hypothetical protein